MMLGKPLRLRSGQRRVSAVTILVGLVMLLVPALAWMQYQWLGQLSTAERERMQRTLRTAAAQFATEFDTELSRTLVSLQVDGADDSRSELDRLRAEVFGMGEQRRASRAWCAMCGWSIRCRAPTLPALDSGAPVPIDRLRIRKWNTQSLAFEDARVARRSAEDARFAGDALHRFPDRSAAARSEAPGTHREAPISLTLGDDNTLISPVTLFEMPDDRRGPPKISVLGFTIVRLDPAVIRDTHAGRADHASLPWQRCGSRLPRRGRQEATIRRRWSGSRSRASRAIVTAAPDVTQGFMGPRPDQMFVFARNLRGDGHSPTATAAAATAAGNRRSGIRAATAPGDRMPFEPTTTSSCR